MLRKLAGRHNDLDVPKVLRVENSRAYPQPALLYLEYVEGATVREHLEDVLLPNLLGRQQQQEQQQQDAIARLHYHVGIALFAKARKEINDSILADFFNHIN